jgi:hypothetical protein
LLRIPSISRVQALQRALAFHQRGNLAEAERLYLDILDTEPDQFDALHLLGVMPGAGRGRRDRRNDKSRTDGFRAPLAAWPSASGDEAPGATYQRRREPGLRVTNQLSAGRAPALPRDTYSLEGVVRQRGSHVLLVITFLRTTTVHFES